MEPFHQLRFANDQISGVGAELRAIGFTVSPQLDSWLGPKYPDFRDVICERDGLRTVLAVGPDTSDAAHTVIVYVNRHDNNLASIVRQHFEARGAEWGYFAS